MNHLPRGRNNSFLWSMNNEANLKLAAFYTIGADVSMLESRVGTYTGSVYLSLFWKRVPDFGASESSTPVYYIKLTFGDLVLWIIHRHSLSNCYVPGTIGWQWESNAPAFSGERQIINRKPTIQCTHQEETSNNGDAILARVTLGREAEFEQGCEWNQRQVLPKMWVPGRGRYGERVGWAKVPRNMLVKSKAFLNVSCFILWSSWDLHSFKQENGTCFGYLVSGTWFETLNSK